MKRDKVCIISLTYNRPKYIERSFDSIYKRVKVDFNHHVFDDNSDAETMKLLRKLQRKYKFKLYHNNERLNIFKNYYYNINKIEKQYDYYVKLDSDIEILTDGIFEKAIKVFKYPDNIVGASPRVEGVIDSDRYERTIEIYGGHVISVNAPIVYGCCLIFTKEVFLSFKRLSNNELQGRTEKWGIDTILYEHAKKVGNFVFIEDLSVYHIDNTYGQRREDEEYYIKRNRWKNLDTDLVWYIKASKEIYPKAITYHEMQRIKSHSGTYDNFVKNCKEFLKNHKTYEKKVEKIKNAPNITKYIRMKKMYKITSPFNFSTDTHLKHGSFKYFSSIPVWAHNNPNLVVEKVEIEDDTIQDNDTNTDKNEFQCDKCDFVAKSARGLKIHKAAKH